jgi:hypothetical protein
MLQPVNKYLVVSPEDVEEEEASLVLVPDEYKQQDSPFMFVTLVQPNFSSTLKPGARLLVHSHLLEEVRFNKQVAHIIPENSVIAFVNSDT